MNDQADGNREAASVALARVMARANATGDDAAKRQGVLEARARRLATPMQQVDAGAADDEMDVLVFLVGDEQLAIPLSSIVAIVRAGVITPLPRAVAPVHGVTAWRGRPLTVLTVGTRVAPLEGGGRLIVLGDGRRALVGLSADTADETLTVRKSALTPSVGGLRSGYALGMTADAVLVLDPEILIHAARPELR